MKGIESFDGNELVGKEADDDKDIKGNDNIDFDGIDLLVAVDVVTDDKSIVFAFELEFEHVIFGDEVLFFVLEGQFDH